MYCIKNYPLALAFGLVLAAASASAVTQRVYLIGNSVTDESRYPDLETYAANGGHTYTWARDSIPGSSLRYHWANPYTGFAEAPYGQFPDAFAYYQWDILSLQPFSDYDTELTNAGYLVDLVRQNSPDVTVYIYSQALNSQTNSWDGGDWLADRTAVDAHNADYFEDFVADLQAAKPGNQSIRMIPTGQVFWELHQRMQAGQIPGYTHIHQLYKDGWHYPPEGDFVVMCSFYATFFGTSPVGVTRFTPYDFDDTLAWHIQDAAWQVVSRHPLSGRAPSFVVTTPSLDRGLVNSVYNTSLEHHGGAAPVTWQLTAGTLPTGLSLSSTGVLSGTPTENGVFPITVLATDNNADTADRTLYLMVDSDSVPVVLTSALSATPVGGYIRESLESVDGIGAITWSVSGGQLPPGVNLSANGEISGTPLSVPGNYAFTAAATDSNPISPSVATRELVLPVISRETGTYEIGQTDVAITVDGSFAESAWQLPATANWIVEGSPDNSVAFGVLWDDQALYLGVEVTDDLIQSDSAEAMADDHVQIFLDALHDREIAYNADDRQIVIAADGRFEETNGRDVGMTHAVATFTGGYRVEVRVPWSNFDTSPVAERFSLGLDIAVGDDDDGGERDGLQVWLSARDADRSPSQFGNLVCYEAEIGTNLLRDSDFALSPNGEQTLGFEEEITTAESGTGWYTGSNRAFSEGPLESVGWPGHCVQTYDDSGGGLLQIVQDGGTTTGEGFLLLDVINPSASVTYDVWGYNGGASTADAKITAACSDIPTSAGSPDGTLASGDLDLPGAPPDTWERVAIPLDFGSGYDYLLVAFSAPNTLPQVRVDNIRLGPALEHRVTYALPPTNATGRSPRQVVVNGDFESDFAGTLAFGVVIQTAQADNGWYRNPNSARELTTLASGGGNPGDALETNGGSEACAMQIIHDGGASQGNGTLEIDLYNPAVNQYIAVYGYNGSAATVDGKLAQATSLGSPQRGDADGVILERDLILENPEADTWHHLRYSADFGDGYDYILVVFGSLSGVDGSRFDNLELTADTEPTEPPTVRIESSDNSAAEQGSDDALLQLILSEPLNFALPVPLLIGGDAANDGSDFPALPATVVVSARETEVTLAIDPTRDQTPEGDETLTAVAQSGNYLLAGAGTSITIADHPIDIWLQSTFGGLPTQDDGDGDRADWLWEYYTGTEPNTSGDARPFGSEPIDWALDQTWFDLELTRDPTANGVVATLLVSDDLQTWAPYAADVLAIQSQSGNPDGTVTRVYRVNKPNGLSNRLFCRWLLGWE